MKKLKDLKTWQIVLLGVVAIALIGLLGTGVGKLISKSSMPEVSQAQFEKLIDTAYSVSDFKKDGADVTMNVKMDTVSETDLEDLAKNIFDKAKSNGWVQEKIELNVFTGEPTNDFEFYTDGLYATIVIDNEKQTASIGTFVDVPAVKKASAEKMTEVKNELVTNNDGKVVISLDMTVDNSEATVMEQSLAYTDVVRTLNKGIKSIELKINPNSEKSYETHTDFDNIVKSVDKIKLVE